MYSYWYYFKFIKINCKLITDPQCRYLSGSPPQLAPKHLLNGWVIPTCFLQLITTMPVPLTTYFCPCYACSPFMPIFLTSTLYPRFLASTYLPNRLVCLGVLTCHFYSDLNVCLLCQESYSPVLIYPKFHGLHPISHSWNCSWVTQEYMALKKNSERADTQYFCSSKLMHPLSYTDISSQEPWWLWICTSANIILKGK